MIALLFFLFALAALLVAGFLGYRYGRSHERQRYFSEPQQQPSLPTVEPAPEIATITIELLGQTTRTGMSIDMPLLEQLANGIGKTLVDKTSRGMH